MRRKPISLKGIDKIKTLYSQGKSIEEIAEILGYKRNTVREKLVTAGVLQKRKKKAYSKDIEEMCKLYKKGKSISEICKIVGFGDATVRSILAKKGLYKKQIKYSNIKRSICWNCAHAAKGKNSECEWAKNLVARDDWEAIRNDIIISNNKSAESYLVISCNGFEKG